MAQINAVNIVLLCPYNDRICVNRLFLTEDTINLQAHRYMANWCH